ncbi:MAG: SH3 domain-containing protein [Lachnospiraceae bacterium]|nr:SH3 domain-containing protein [Lachnospiraceae bacterium]
MKKKSVILATVGVMSVFMSLNSFASQWVQFGQNWAYYQDDGTFAKNQWVGDYYLGANGIMLTNAMTPDGYYVGTDGSKQLGDVQKENLNESAISFQNTSVYVTTTGVKVRTEPNTDCRVLAVLDAGTQVIFKGSTNGWANIDYKGQNAYVKSDFIKPSGVEKSQNKNGQSASAQYADIISYIAMFARGEVDFLEPQYKSYSSYYLPTDAPINRENRFGYVLRDIDSDGVDELLLTSGEYGELYDYIYAIVTIKDGKAYPIAYEGGARNRFYLCQNNIISNEGSNGAAYSVSKYYRVASGKLIRIESVYSEQGEDCIVWYNSVNHSAPKQISMDEAELIQNNYVHQALIPVIIK